MEYSLLFAKIFSLIYLSLGVGILLNQGYYKKIFLEMSTPIALFMRGMISLFLGILIIFFHNIWIFSAEVFITLVGWIALLKGVSLLILPQMNEKILKNIFHQKYIIPFSGGVCVFLGILFGIFGIFHG